MDDPMVIATRYATIARKMVNDAAQVAIDAFDKINKTGGSTYTAADAIESMTTLAGIAISGGSALVRIPLQIQPDNGPMLVADEVAAVITLACTARGRSPPMPPKRSTTAPSEPTGPTRQSR